MRNLSFILTLSMFLLILLPGTSFGETIAISYFQDNSQEKAYSNLEKGLANMMITQFSNTEGVNVVERDRLSELLKEIELGKGGYIDEKTAPKLGKGLGAGYILFGSYMVMGDSVRIDARLMNVESGKVEVSDSVSGTSSNLFPMVDQLGEKLLQRFQYRAPADAQSASLNDIATYSEGLVLLDEGKVKEGSDLLKTLTMKSPKFNLAKTSYKESLKRLYSARSARTDLFDSSQEQLMQSASKILAVGPATAAMSPEQQSEIIGYRLLRGQFMVHQLKKALIVYKKERDKVCEPAAKMPGYPTIDGVRCCVMAGKWGDCDNSAGNFLPAKHASSVIPQMNKYIENQFQLVKDIEVVMNSKKSGAQSPKQPTVNVPVMQRPPGVDDATWAQIKAAQAQSAQQMSQVMAMRNQFAAARGDTDAIEGEISPEDYERALTLKVLSRREWMPSSATGKMKVKLFPDSVAMGVGMFVLTGKTRIDLDGRLEFAHQGYTGMGGSEKTLMWPSPAMINPELVGPSLELMELGVRINQASEGQMAKMTGETLLFIVGSVFHAVGKEDDALRYWQALLDAYPAGRYFDTTESRIKAILGVDESCSDCNYVGTPNDDRAVDSFLYQQFRDPRRDNMFPIPRYDAKPVSEW